MTICLWQQNRLLGSHSCDELHLESQKEARVLPVETFSRYSFEIWKGFSYRILPTFWLIISFLCRELMVLFRNHSVAWCLTESVTTFGVAFWNLLLTIFHKILLISSRVKKWDRHKLLKIYWIWTIFDFLNAAHLQYFKREGYSFTE